MWYVIPESCKTRSKSFVTAEPLPSDYFDDHHRGVKQIVATKDLFFNPTLVTGPTFHVKGTKIVQSNGQFVIFELKVYHEVFDTGYNIAKATNYADFSWSDYGIIVARIKKCERPFTQFTLPVERIFDSKCNKSSKTKVWTLLLHLIRTEEG